MIKKIVPFIFALLISSTVYAEPLLLTDGTSVRFTWPSNTYGHNPAGEFAVSGVTGTATPFKTFCVESDEFINLEHSYFVVMNTQAIRGGAGVLGTYVGDPNGVLNSYDPLSSATAWLYSQYRAITLQDYVPYSYTDNSDANSLQMAIWWLENEMTSRSGLTAKSNQLIDSALSNNTGNIGNVRIMNVWGVRTGTNPSNYVFSDNKQDMLCLSTDFIVPEPSLTLAGLLCGVILLNVKRKQYKTTNI